MSDHDPKKNKENELDPNTQLEKRPFVATAGKGWSEPNLTNAVPSQQGKFKNLV